MDQLPTASPSIFVTNDGELPTHSVFLSGNDNNSMMMEASFLNNNYNATNTVLIRTQQQQQQQQYHGNALNKMEHSFENSSVRKAWGIENNQSNNKNIPVMQTARSLEFVKSRHSNSQIKAYEPERWSHDDATLSNTGSSYNNSSNNMMASENFYNSNNNVSPYYGSNNTSNINPYYNSQGYPIPAEINIQQQQMRQMQQQQQQQQQQLRQMQPRQNGNDYRNNNYSSYSSTSDILVF